MKTFIYSLLFFGSLFALCLSAYEFGRWSWRVEVATSRPAQTWRVSQGSQTWDLVELKSNGVYDVWYEGKTVDGRKVEIYGSFSIEELGNAQ